MEDFAEWYAAECMKDSIQLNWPKDSTHFWGGFYDINGMLLGGPVVSKKRPIQAPTFKIGDKVFCGNTMTIYTILNIENNEVVLSQRGFVPIKAIKHATIELMGADWEAIP